MIQEQRSFLEAKLLKDYQLELDDEGVSGERLAYRLGKIAEIGLTNEGGSHRIGFSKGEREAKELVKSWMQAAGLKVTEDGAGNVFGRLAGKQAHLPAILAGSHVDTVPNGGHFDGVLGVLTALEVVEAWKQSNYQPEKPFEVVIFTDEEGSRFNGGLTGSEGMMGNIKLEERKQLKDQNGLSFQEVLEADGLSLEGYVQSPRPLDELEMFVEVHIEQGKQLEKAGLPCGIVTGIAGPCWLEIKLSGVAGHAGNTPMNDRQDALVAASQFVYEVSKLPKQVSETAVATVGKMFVHPNGANVIPGEVQLYVDIRDIFEETRNQLVDSVISCLDEIAAQSQVKVKVKELLRVPPVPIASDMQEKLSHSLQAHGIKEMRLPSGAGHDAMIVGEKLPVAMLFVRSKDGISHNPKEWTSLSDCVQAVHVLKHFVEQLQQK